MTCPDCDREIHHDRCTCGWKVPKAAEVHAEAHRLQVRGPLLTKEQFGLDLYECIKLFSLRQWLRDEQQRTANSIRLTPLEKRLKLEDLKKREAVTTREITAVMPKIQPADAKRLLEKYETPVAV